MHGFSRVGNTSKKYNYMTFFSSFFDQKRPKKLEKMRWSSAPGKHCFESALLGAFLSQNIDFLVDFGCQGASNWAPKSIPKRKNRILVPLGGPRVLQEAILGRFSVNFGGILRPLGGILAPLWGYTGRKKLKQQHISANSSKHAANSSKQHEKAANSTKKHQIVENGSKQQRILKA